jgi:hypothetical protein
VDVSIQLRRSINLRRLLEFQIAGIVRTSQTVMARILVGTIRYTGASYIIQRLEGLQLEAQEVRRSDFHNKAQERLKIDC